MPSTAPKWARIQRCARSRRNTGTCTATWTRSSVRNSAAATESDCQRYASSTMRMKSCRAACRMRSFQIHTRPKTSLAIRTRKQRWLETKLGSKPTWWSLQTSSSTCWRTLRIYRSTLHSLAACLRITGPKTSYPSCKSKKLNKSRLNLRSSRAPASPNLKRCQKQQDWLLKW